MWDDSRVVLYAVEPARFDLSRCELDPHLICEQVQTGGGTAIKLQVHSEQGHTYYPSEIGPLPPDYEIGRDYVAEFIDATRRHGLQLAFSLSAAPNPQVAAARPEWRQVGPDGKPAHWRGLELLCMHTGYREYFHELLREFVAQYLPDCICIDNFVLMVGCRCDGCVEAFRGDTGLELSGVEGDGEVKRRYLAWRLERTERLAWQAAMAAKSLKGDLRVAFSGVGWEAAGADELGWRPEHVADWMDGVHSQFAVRGAGHDLGEAELLGAYHRALGKRGWCSVEYSPIPFERLACPPAELRVKAALVIGSGCRPCVSPLLPPSEGDDSGLRYLGEFLAQFEGQEEWLQAEGSFARTAVLHSRSSSDATGRVSDDLTRAWCGALTREHILWDFVLDRQITSGDLSRYRVLLVPGTAYIEPRNLAAIDAYVRSGGAVIFVEEATGFGPSGEPLSDFAAADMLGVRWASRSDEAGAVDGGEAVAYVRVGEGPLETLAGRLVPSAGHVPVQVASAQPVAHVIPQRKGHGLGVTDEETECPAIAWRMHGGGKAAYVGARLGPVIAGGPGPAFTAAEHLIGEFVRWLGGERIRVRAPRNVSILVHRVARGAAIHVVNKPEESPYVHERVRRLARIEIVIPQTLYVGDVSALDDTAVDWSHQNDRLTISLAGIAEYRCLRVEGALG